MSDVCGRAACQGVMAGGSPGGGLVALGQHGGLKLELELLQLPQRCRPHPVTTSRARAQAARKSLLVIIVRSFSGWAIRGRPG